MQTFYMSKDKLRAATVTNLHIALDARMMGAQKTRGIGRYIEETIGAVLEVEPELRYTLVVRALKDSPFVDHPRVDHIVADIPWYSLEEQWRMGKTLEDIGADLIHVPHWNVPWRLKKSFVVTIHDLLLTHQPTSAKTSQRSFLMRWFKWVGFQIVLRRALKKARRIFVPTQFVAQEVKNFAPTTNKNIEVTGEGITSFSSVDSSLCPTSSFVLYVGSAYPHKRLDVLCEAWKTVSTRYPKHKLVIAGEVDVFMQNILDTRYSIPDTIQFLGRVTDAQLASLYQEADAFVFPSSHEGFGLPPLEALSQGCPVVASDIPSLREVLPKEGVEWFRVGDVHGMIEALERTLCDLPRAKRSAARIRETVKLMHDWRRSAEKLVRGYRGVIEQ